MRTQPFVWVVAGMLVAGCAGPVRKPVPRPAPPQAGVLMSKDGSVVIRMPADWVAYDPEAPALKSLTTKLGAANPFIKKVARQSAGTSLLGFCLTQAKLKAEAVDIVSVKTSPAVGRSGFTSAEIAGWRLAYAKQMDAVGKAFMEAVTLDAGPTLHYVARLRVRRTGAPTAFVQTIGYLVLHGGSTYMVTFTTAPERAKAMTRIADQAVKTLSFGPPKR